MTSPHLDPHQLEAFVAVISNGSMTGAAKALGRSQSAISRLIQDLETDLKYRLLHRNGPRFTPTQQGIRFFEQAELYLSGLRTINMRAREIDNVTTAAIEIASVPSLSASLIPAALASLSTEEFPNHINLKSISSEAVVQAILARTADIGLASIPLEHSGLDVHMIGQVPCVAIMSNNSPLTKLEQIKPTDLNGQRLILSSNIYRLRLQIQSALEAHGTHINAVINSNATYSSLALVRSGLGIAVVESATIFGLPLEGLTIRHLTITLNYSWGLITAAGRPLSHPSEKLIQAIQSCVKQLPGYRQLTPSIPQTD